jgi:ubiquinol-cytochrome c reductase cytochrome c1 subunit
MLTVIRFEKIGLARAALAMVLALCSAARAQEGPDEHPSPARQSWSFSGLFGTYDQAQLQRGFKIYRDVCSNCHRLSIPFRTLEDPSGPGFSEAQIKALASTYQVTNDTPNDKGEIFKRPGISSDIIPPPEAYPNPEAAAATRPDSRVDPPREEA